MPVPPLSDGRVPSGKVSLVMTKRTAALTALLLLLVASLLGGIARGQNNVVAPGNAAVMGGRAAIRQLPTPTPVPTNTPVPTPTSTPTPLPQPMSTPVTSAAIPATRVLGPMSHEYQRMNNCGPVTVLMTLSYFGQQHSQAAVANALRPSPHDASVGAVEMVGYLREQGLHGVVRLGGTTDLLRAFVANGIPVMVPHLLNSHEDIGHFTVLRGYDKTSNTFLINDSYYGPNRYVPVSEYMRLWEPYERAFIPVYRPAQEPIIRELLGADWDVGYNARRYVGEARTLVANNPSAETYMSLGYGLYVAGDYGGAVEAYRTAVRYGLSKRTLWYAMWPAAALNRTGQHGEALELTRTALAQNPAASEMLVEKGNALVGLGRRAEAREAYRLAREYAPYLPEARKAPLQ